MQKGCRVCRVNFFCGLEWLSLFCLCRSFMISKVYLYSNSECCAVASGALTTYIVIFQCLATFPVYSTQPSTVFPQTQPPIPLYLAPVPICCTVLSHLSPYVYMYCTVQPPIPLNLAKYRHILYLASSYSYYQLQYLASSYPPITSPL